MTGLKLSFKKTTYVISNNNTYCKIKCAIKRNGTIIEEFNVLGKAMLSDGDEYNETIGRRIAESKAKRKAYLKARNYVFNIHKTISEEADDFLYCTKIMEKLFNKESEHIKNLVNETNK